MKKIFITFAILLSTKVSVLSQNSNFFWIAPELGYGWVLADKGSYELVNPDDKMYMGNFLVAFGYYFTPQFSVGAKLGATAYHNYDMNIVPIFIDFRYNFKPIPHLFTYVDIGLPLSAETESSNAFGDFSGNYNVDYTSGFLANVGIGYNVAIGERTSLRASAGYHLFSYAVAINFEDRTMTDDRIKQGLSLQFGLEFSLIPVVGMKAKAEQKQRRKEFWQASAILTLLQFFGVSKNSEFP